MEEIEKSKQYLCSLTVLRYSCIREIDGKFGWGFNFQGQSQSCYARWLELLKPQIPNGAEYSRIDILSEVLSWSQLEGYGAFPLGTAVNEALSEAERKAKDKQDDDLMIYTNSKGSSIKEAILKEVDLVGTKYTSMAIVTSDLAKLMFQHGILWIQRKMRLLRKILDEEEKILKVQAGLINIGWDVVQNTVKNKDEVDTRLEPMRKQEKELNIHLKEYGELKLVDDTNGSIDEKKEYFMVRSLGNWEDLNVVDSFNSKQAIGWINKGETKVYLTEVKKGINLESFSEKYKKNQMDVTKGVAQALQFITT